MFEARTRHVMVFFESTDSENEACVYVVDTYTPASSTARRGRDQRSCSLFGWLVREEILLVDLCERKILFRLKIYDHLRQATAKQTGSSGGVVGGCCWTTTPRYSYYSHTGRMRTLARRRPRYLAHTLPLTQ